MMFIELACPTRSLHDTDRFYVTTLNKNPEKYLRRNGNSFVVDNGIGPDNEYTFTERHLAHRAAEQYYMDNNMKYPYEADYWYTLQHETCLPSNDPAQIIKSEVMEFI